MGQSHAQQLLGHIRNDDDPRGTSRAVDKLWDRYDTNGDGMCNNVEELLNVVALYCKDVLLDSGVLITDATCDGDSMMDVRIKEFLRATLDWNSNGELSKDDFVNRIRQAIMDDQILNGLRRWDSLTSEHKIMVLQRETEGLKKSVALSESALVAQFAMLFEDIHGDALLRVRCKLDSNQIFRSDGQAVDLRTIVFEVLDESERLRVLAHIEKECRGVPPRSFPFVLFSDVDDTLLPGHDSLKISGEDRSWTLDGSLYPGVVQLHKELRGSGPDDYTVLFTARPPRMCRSLGKKLGRIAGLADRRRLSILPGASIWQGVRNVASIMASSFDSLGEKKMERFREYVQLFPDAAGRYAFIGDDGQADFDITDAMLASKHPETGQHFLAFVAIHAVGTASWHKYHAEERDDRIKTLRSAHRALFARGEQEMHRFFYFVDYSDLASQLYHAGWLSVEADQRVQGWFQADMAGVATSFSDIGACAGFIHAGGDIKQAEMTLADAMQEAADLPECKGFCFKGDVSDFDAPKHIYFKNQVAMTGDSAWTSYIFTRNVLWHSDYTFNLGTNRSRFEGKAVLVDQTSVSHIIELLNGKTDDPKLEAAHKDGFCVAWSGSQRSFFLICKKGYKNIACTKLGIA